MFFFSDPRNPPKRLINLEGRPSVVSQVPVARQRPQLKQFPAPHNPHNRHFTFNPLGTTTQCLLNAKFCLFSKKIYQRIFNIGRPPSWGQSILFKLFLHVVIGEGKHLILVVQFMSLRSLWQRRFVPQISFSLSVFSCIIFTTHACLTHQSCMPLKEENQSCICSSCDFLQHVFKWTNSLTCIPYFNTEVLF